MDQLRSLARATVPDATIRNAMAFWMMTRVQNTFRRVYGDEAGLPRFKPKARWQSFGVSGWKAINLKTIGSRKACLAIEGMPGAI